MRVSALDMLVHICIDCWTLSAGSTVHHPVDHQGRAMPRYHFNVYDGRSDLDTEGSELSDDGVARREGLQLASAILEEDASNFADGTWRLEVTDRQGTILFRLDMSANTRPGVEGPFRLR